MKRICLLLCLIASLGFTACGAPRPAAINERGRKPVNDLKYYPQLTESQRKKFSNDKARANSSKRSGNGGKSGARSS